MDIGSEMNVTEEWAVEGVEGENHGNQEIL